MAGVTVGAESGSTRAGRGQVVVVVPRRPSRTGAVDSQLLAAAHLSRGFADVLGRDRVVLLTADGISTPGDVLASAVRQDVTQASRAAATVARLPLGVRLALGDAQAVRQSRRLSRLTVDGPVGLVVQYHHRFQDLGFRIAESARRPLLLRVEALEVEEQRDWGMGRPVVGPAVARFGEHRLIRRADLVSTVSAPLASAVGGLGIAQDRILAQPNAVDLDLFRPGQHEPLPGLEGRFVIGWAGGFRPYHGLGQIAALLPRLEKRLPDATLCLIGTGPMRTELEEVAGRHPESLRLLPPVPQSDLPTRLTNFDIGFQLAPLGGAEHYSPLKILEYLACGLPVVAPDIASSDLLSDGRDALLYPAGDLDTFVERVARIHDDPHLSARMGSEARLTAERRGSWGALASAMLDAVQSLPPRPTKED